MLIDWSFIFALLTARAKSIMYIRCIGYYTLYKSRFKSWQDANWSLRLKIAFFKSQIQLLIWFRFYCWYQCTWNNTLNVYLYHSTADVSFLSVTTWCSVQRAKCKIWIVLIDLYCNCQIIYQLFMGLTEFQEIFLSYLFGSKLLWYEWRSNHLKSFYLRLSLS